MTIYRKPYLFTVDEFQRMAQAGVFTDDERLELIAGEILEIGHMGHRHAACVDRLTALCAEQLARKAVVRVQGPLQVNKRSQSQSDILLLKPKSGFYEDRLPIPEDVILLMEASDSTLEYDRGVKLALYARNLVPKIWIIDLQSEMIEVYTQPKGNNYAEFRQFGRGEAITSAYLPELALDADSVLGKAK